MRIIYILNQRLPTEKAYGIQVSQMCQAFADAGHVIVLLAPTRVNTTKRDLFDFYGIKKNFAFELVWAPDFYLPGGADRIAFWIKNLISSIIIAVSALRRGADLYYCRDELPTLWLLLAGKKVVYEAHRVSIGKSFFYKLFSALGAKVVAISGGIKKSILAYGFEDDAVLVAADGVNLEEFNPSMTKDEAREKIPALRIAQKIVMYVGHLYDWKGVNLLVTASKKLQGVRLVLVGGESEQIPGEESSDIIRIGHIPHSEVALYMQAADVLILPNKDDGGISTHYTSPLKMFEYMASRRPIVASDLPSIREVLNESSAILVKPNDPEQLAVGINKILDDPSLGEKLAEQAYRDVQGYSWEKRVRKILNFSHR